MSAPRTNIETQKRRHRGPLIGMALVVLFGLGIIIYWLLEQSANADNPQGSEVPDADRGVPVEEVRSGTVRVPDAAPATGGTNGTGTAPDGTLAPSPPPPRTE